MITVIALGKTALDYVQGFEQYDEYDIYRIGVGVKESSKTKSIKKCKNSEEYEKLKVNFKSFLKNVEEEVIFLCSGSDSESGLSLKVLENIKEKNISILYLKTDVDLLSAIDQMQEKVVFNVLQQYTRSGLFKRIYLISLSKVEEIMGDVSISEYKQKMGDLIASNYHMIKVFQNSNQIMGNIEDFEEPNRISTIGQTNLGKEQEMLFFNLNKSFEKAYYFAISEKTLANEKGLVTKIKEQVKTKIEENTKVMYGIYSTKYEHDYVFCHMNTKIVQD